jgi:hypothetical protein
VREKGSREAAAFHTCPSMFTVYGARQPEAGGQHGWLH